MHHNLPQIISALKAVPVPPVGPGFDEAVLREIRLRQQTVKWWTAWENPRVMAAAAAAAVIIGLTTAFVAPRPPMTDAEALGLDVFSATPRHLPLTLLARR